MYINRKLPEIPVGDWAKKYDVPNPGLIARAWYGRLTPEQNQRGRAGYMSSCTHIDYQLGFLMEELTRNFKALGNTLILFTSDHGDMMGDHHLHRKTYAYEGSARIPFLIRYPNHWELPTGTFENVVGLQDVMPTLLEAAGVSIPDTVTGKSVLGAIRGEKWRDFIHGEHSPNYSLEQGVQYLTDGKEKYIYFPATGEEQFFDLKKDRQELHDLAKEAAEGERVAMWRERLIKILAQRRSPFTDGKKLLVHKEWWPPVVGEETS
jgi:arylsulfatase A-like enzyme